MADQFISPFPEPSRRQPAPAAPGYGGFPGSGYDGFPGRTDAPAAYGGFPDGSYGGFPRADAPVAGGSYSGFPSPSQDDPMIIDDNGSNFTTKPHVNRGASDINTQPAFQNRGEFYAQPGFRDKSDSTLPGEILDDEITTENTKSHIVRNGYDINTQPGFRDKGEPNLTGDEWGENPVRKDQLRVDDVMDSATRTAKRELDVEGQSPEIEGTHLNQDEFVRMDAPQSVVQQDPNIRTDNRRIGGLTIGKDLDINGDVMKLPPASQSDNGVGYVPGFSDAQPNK